MRRLRPSGAGLASLGAVRSAGAITVIALRRSAAESLCRHRLGQPTGIGSKISRMLGFDEALAQVLASAPSLGSEVVPLERAGGRVLVETIAARPPLPPFD